MSTTSIQLFDREIRSIHAVGVCGMGLGPLAIFLAGSGITVSGADDNRNELVARWLETAGVHLMDTDSGLPENCDLVVVSSAIHRDHPLMVAARVRGIAVCRRGELLAELAKSRRLVAICGSHGKTSTTAMLVWALRAAGMDVGYILGGLLDVEVSPAAWTRKGWLVAEIDESDGTIDLFSPEITVCVNLDWDHPDHYLTEDSLVDSFASLFKRTNRRVLLNASCNLSAKIRCGVAPDHVKTFGAAGDFRLISTRSGVAGMALELGGEFCILAHDLHSWGEFNAINATAALAAASEMGTKLSARLLADYPGVRRRQSVLHTTGGWKAIEDYAHHPAEISALVESLRTRLAEGGHLLLVFQPHRFSRTAQFADAFAAALAKADKTYLLDVYSAGEDPSMGAASDAILEAAGTHMRTPVYSKQGDKLTWLRLVRDVRPGDLVAFVGAGDIDRAARQWIPEIEKAVTENVKWDELAAAWMPMLKTGSRLLREESLGNKTTIRVGGAARLYVEPVDEEDLALLWMLAGASGIRRLMLGRGSNLVVPDEGVDALVISLRLPNWEQFEVQADGRVKVGAGLRLKNLCGLAANAGLSGFEFLEGIPGNVGGALRMNAGAMGGWMFNVVSAVRLMQADGKIVEKTREEMRYDYRCCEDLVDAVALAAWIVPSGKDASDTVAGQVTAYREKRQKSQPRESSAGCMFKNPPGDSAGRIIDSCGLKGSQIGPAEVSPVHANFIVNHGTATADEVIGLMRRVRASVREKTGITLEPEVMLFGKNWNDVL